jgi:hypothetical protein
MKNLKEILLFRVCASIPLPSLHHNFLFFCNFFLLHPILPRSPYLDHNHPLKLLSVDPFSHLFEPPRTSLTMAYGGGYGGGGGGYGGGGRDGGYGGGNGA